MNTRLRRKAQEVLKDKKAMGRIIGDAAAKADRHRHKIPEMWENLKALFRLVGAWIRGDYRNVPWRSLVAAVAAILYFINPFDLIPDFVIGGYIDDAVFVGWTVAAIRADVEKFLLWEKTIPAEKVSEVSIEAPVPGDGNCP